MKTIDSQYGVNNACIGQPNVRLINQGVKFVNDNVSEVGTKADLAFALANINEVELV